MLWLTKVDSIPKREWMFFLSISVGCQVPFWVSQHCSTTECQFGVFSQCFVSALSDHSHRRRHDTRTQRAEAMVHLKDVLSDFHYCTPVRDKKVSCLSTSHKYLGWGTWKVFSDCNFQVPPHHRNAKATVSNTWSFHIIGNFTESSRGSALGSY